MRREERLKERLILGQHGAPERVEVRAGGQAGGIAAQVTGLVVHHDGRDKLVDLVEVGEHLVQVGVRIHTLAQYGAFERVLTERTQHADRYRLGVGAQVRGVLYPLYGEALHLTDEVAEVVGVRIAFPAFRTVARAQHEVEVILAGKHHLLVPGLRGGAVVEGEDVRAEEQFGDLLLVHLRTGLDRDHFVGPGRGGDLRQAYDLRLHYQAVGELQRYLGGLAGHNGDVGHYRRGPVEAKTAGPHGYRIKAGREVGEGKGAVVVHAPIFAYIHVLAAHADNHAVRSRRRQVLGGLVA